MIDVDLSELYNVETRYLNRQVKRNIDRFPNDFMFQLTTDEFNDLKCHFGTSSWGGKRKRPFVFTENGVAMLSSILRSKRAIQVNIQIMRIFTKIREIILSNKDLKYKIKELEKKYNNHEQQIRTIFNAIKELLQPVPSKPKKKIGFITN